MYYVLREKTTGVESFSINGKTPDDAIYRSRGNLDVVNPSYTLLSEAEIFLIQSVFNLDIEILKVKNDWPGYNPKE